MTTETPPSIPTFDATISRIEDLTPRVKGFRFQLDPGQQVSFNAGQYAQILIPTPEKLRRTSYSIASPPQEKDHLDFCVTLVQQGVTSPLLPYLVTGAKFQIVAPMGKFTAPETLPRDTVFVAAGSGISPFRSIILDQLARNTARHITLVFGNRFEQDIIYRREWEALAARHDNFHPHFILSQGAPEWVGLRGYVQEALEHKVGDLATKDYYLCGLKTMINAVSEKLQGLGVPSQQILYERYD